MLFTALGRWGSAFPSSPQLLERLIGALGAYSLIRYPDSISFVLSTAEDHYERLNQHSSLVVPWMRLMVLSEVQVAHSDRAKLIQFLDQLAKHDVNALQLQRDLEA